VIVLIPRAHTHLTHQVIDKLPSQADCQTGRIGSHVRCGRLAQARHCCGGGRRYSDCASRTDLGAGRWQPCDAFTSMCGRTSQTWCVYVRAQSASMPPDFGLGCVLRAETLGIWSYGKTNHGGRLTGRRTGDHLGQPASRTRKPTDLKLRPARSSFQAMRCTEPAPTAEKRPASSHWTTCHYVKPTALLVVTCRAQSDEALIAALNEDVPAWRRRVESGLLRGHALCVEELHLHAHIGYVDGTATRYYFKPLL
jgi:D-3-phosphoglycerate dehydrogenase